MKRNLTDDWSAIGSYTTRLLGKEAEMVIKQHDPESGPLFLFLAHYAPHSGNVYDSLQAPSETVALFGHIADIKRRTYAAMVYEMDRTIGQVMKALKDRNILDNTIVIFSGDNGGAANGMDNNFASNFPFRGGKNSTWEGGVRVNGLIWSPLIPEEKRGKAVENLMDLTDWLPTLYEAAGGDASALGAIDGVSQWKAIVEGTGPQSRSELVHNIDDVFGYAGIRKGDYKLIKGTTMNGDFDDWNTRTDGMQNLNEAQYRQILEDSETFKSISSLNMQLKGNLTGQRAQLQVTCQRSPSDVLCNPLDSPSPFCLFDARKDPCEFNNLASTLPVVFQEMIQLLDRFNSTAVPSLYPILPFDSTGDPKYWNCTVVPWADLTFNVSAEIPGACLKVTTNKSQSKNKLHPFLIVITILAGLIAVYFAE